MSRATFGPKVLLTFLIWMIDIVCYLFICCLRVAAAWQLLLLPLGLAALAWLLWLGMAAALAWLPGLAWLLLGLAALAWHGCCFGLAALSFAGRTTYKYTKILQKPSEDMRLLASSPSPRRQAVPSRTVSLRSTGLRLSQNFSTPVSFADSPFQGHTAFTMLRPVAPLLRFSTKTSLTLHHDR